MVVNWRVSWLSFGDYSCETKLIRRRDEALIWPKYFVLTINFDSCFRENCYENHQKRWFLDCVVAQYHCQSRLTTSGHHKWEHRSQTRMPLELLFNNLLYCPTWMFLTFNFRKISLQINEFGRSFIWKLLCVFDSGTNHYGNMGDEMKWFCNFLVFVCSKMGNMFLASFKEV